LYFVVFTIQLFKSMCHPNHSIHHLLPSDRKAKQYNKNQMFVNIILTIGVSHKLMMSLVWWLLLLLVPWSAWTVGAITDCLYLVLSSVIDAASLRSLPHHFKMSSIYLRAGRPGRRSPSTIPNNNAFNSRSSDILQICPNSWSFLIQIVSITVSFCCTTAHICSLVLLSWDFTAKICL